MYQDASFELSNGTISWFLIFHLVRWDPYGKGGSEHYAKEMDRSKTVFKVIFLEPRVFPMQINVRLNKIPNLFFYAQPYSTRNQQIFILLPLFAIYHIPAYSLSSLSACLPAWEAGRLPGQEEDSGLHQCQAKFFTLLVLRKHLYRAKIPFRLLIYRTKGMHWALNTFFFLQSDCFLKHPTINPFRKNAVNFEPMHDILISFGI